MSSLCVLIIGYVWPEPQSSAAGLRSWNVIDSFRKNGWEVHFSSPSKDNECRAKLEREGIATAIFEANDSNFDSYVAKLNPLVVVFDRFVIEEQFGWRVRAACPDAARIVDTQDLHLLRRAREAAIKSGLPLESIFSADIPLATDDAVREIASILRSDLAWVLSSFERDLLKGRFDLPEERISLSGFGYRDIPDFRSERFEEKSGFVMLGNFRHAPNWDAVNWLRREIWPLIRARLPAAEVRVFGAYPPKEAFALHDPKLGFHVLGQAEAAATVLRTARVNLAPLRFGAGIKGKISDGWWSGTPVVATPIGAEGMGEPGSEGSHWGGEIAQNAAEFAEKAVLLHEDRERWSSARDRGADILRERFEFEAMSRSLMEDVSNLLSDLSLRRERNFIGSILWHQSHRSTEYFSRWIELKNQRAGPTQGG